MNLITTKSISYLPLLIVIFAASICEAFTPKNYYLLSCGASSASLSANPSTLDGRIWQSDDNSTFSSFIARSRNAVAAYHDPSIHQIPFWTARIFRSNFTYYFPVSPGPKFLRLYFYPATYFNDLEASQFLFSVQANKHLLLKNFSAYVSTKVTGVPFLRKEYYLNVPEGAESLQLTFAPATLSSYAFVNGIEVVSAPDALFITPVGPMYVSDPRSSYEIGDSVAMETVYRLNVGGNEVDVLTDGSQTGIYRLWEGADDRFLLPNDVSIYTGMGEKPIIYTAETPNYTAPADVYLSSRSMGKNVTDNLRENLTWMFPVDVGFQYLLRLDWCEEDVTVTAANGRVFYVYINNQTAEERADPMEWANNVQSSPVHKDYVVDVSVGDGARIKEFLWLAMHPNTAQHPRLADALLNGLELFKISPADGGLNSPNPMLKLPPTSNGQVANKVPKQKSHILGAVLGSIAVLLFMCFVVLVFYTLSSGRCKWHKDQVDNSQLSAIIKFLAPKKLGKPSNRCSRFLLSQIKSATGNCSDTFIIGTGGFGNVYVGTVDGGQGPVKVAIKRLKPSSKQGITEFRTEIEMLSNLDHEHLVPLLGYCDDESEMILVYEYMKHGTLRDHLYNTDNPPLSWTQRLSICIGAARGLHYLHAGGKQMIIHRDVKSSNILLDEGLVAKVSDFGLSKVGPASEEFHHISTRVKGSMGYVDPEYYRRKQLTEKSDVYSFGVVLFEVLCGRPAVNLNLPKEEMNLALWARRHQQRGNLDAIVDPDLKGQIEPECLRQFGEIAGRCVRSNGAERPSMAEVVQALEIFSVN